MPTEQGLRPGNDHSQAAVLVGVTMRGLEHPQRWTLLDRDTQRVIMRDASLEKLRPFGRLFARLGVAIDYRREAWRDAVATERRSA